MRGTLLGAIHEERLGRIIPAHAGNSASSTTATAAASDHPRACGELALVLKSGMAEYGSSPRMRGTRSSSCAAARSLRIIPAHAGNSSPRKPSSLTRPDHPRACGELACDVAQKHRALGSSPPMRGTPRRRSCALLVRRIIPAHAGNSGWSPASTACTADHPRACGELMSAVKTNPPYPGSSPRMRGTRVPVRSGAVRYRIIPAHAGNSACANRNAIS